ncbi:type II toxin-antitoxin system death-on-curing family toxin [Abyssalbus ytuae]|uniref:Type II toxin-antitoxin system death-on-curing family toxin n=1 Tax=Abyssalbus ytuae TaxID=2926907 RepID=A0A9E6ZR37_9FLAO|nr:type II toxin-antitoxin system death-on-curing family toxin [Abyssalbus ytuae]UOB16348.1 type II toxin-antitoxin system death-on-curing family toxin [Abyssalbus ytuae]
MISAKLALELNEIIIKFSGGTSGIRDENLLLSALNRPFQTFDGNDLYPSAIDKSAAIFESIILNHPFIDGNKRVAYAFLRIMLTENGIEIEATEDEKYNFVISASKGELNFEKIKNWIITHIKK